MKLIKHNGLAHVERPGADPLPLIHVIGIGRNYAEHATEQGADVPDRPMVFTKNPASIVLDNDPIVIPNICTDPDTGGPEQVDFEAELAVVIGAPARNVRAADAIDHILGYTCANDVSARWWQKKGSGGQFCRGKSFDTFCPLGPELIPSAEIPNPNALAIHCDVSGERLQDASTDQMIFPIPTLISELSKSTTLLPGTVILTGTPSGVGMARTPPRYLRPGDTVRIEIEHIGVLTNPVTAASTESQS